MATKKEILVYPTRTNQIPRHIPPPHWASHPWVLFFAAGLLPFGTIFVELYFAMTSIWQVKFSFLAALLVSSLVHRPKHEECVMVRITTRAWPDMVWTFV